VTAAILGFAGIVAAALLGLLGVLRTSRPPAHLADVEGLAKLVDELQEERDHLQTQLDGCRAALARAIGGRDELRRQNRRGEGEGTVA
jgi:hypothetical protein